MNKTIHNMVWQKASIDKQIEAATNLIEAAYLTNDTKSADALREHAKILLDKKHVLIRDIVYETRKLVR